MTMLRDRLILAAACACAILFPLTGPQPSRWVQASELAGRGDFAQQDQGKSDADAAAKLDAFLRPAGEAESHGAADAEIDWWNRITSLLVALGTLALALVGYVGSRIAIRTLRDIGHQTEYARVAADAAKASADAAISTERAWIMVDLEHVPGVGTVLHTAATEGSGAPQYSIAVSLRSVCSNQGKTPAKILEQRAVLLVVTPNQPLPVEPNLDIEIQDAVPEYLQSRDESKRDWTLTADGKADQGTTLVVYGVVRYFHMFSDKEVRTTFGYRITEDQEFERLTGYPKYNENT